ncbi:MAG: ChaN family lipoprotein [Nitrospirota bacterium]
MAMMKAAFSVLIFLVLLPGYAGADEQIPRYDLSVSFDIGKNLLKGIARITIPDEGKIEIIPGDLDILSVSLNGQPLEFQPAEGVFPIAGKGVVEITYEGTFSGEDMSRWKASRIPYDVISEAGISLSRRWYPAIGSLALFSLKAAVPEGYTAISSADRVTVLRKGREAEFSFPHPAQSIFLVAGKYVETEEIVEGTRVRAYFFHGNRSGAGRYMESARKYLTAYGKLFGSYPFESLTIAETVLPAGFSMPAAVVIGKDEMRHATLGERSFRRYIVSQWFGNSVYADMSGGNWADGLSAYLAYLRPEEEAGRGPQFRKRILVDYESYVNPAQEIALKDYQHATDFASAAIGYGKGAMIFHMLRNEVGEDAFYGALNTIGSKWRFQEVSWDDLRAAFEKTSESDLSWFFDQWLSGKGLLPLTVSDPGVFLDKGIQKVTFEVVQENEPYRFRLPMKMKTDRGEISDVLDVPKETKRIEIPVEGNPREVVFDSSYDLVRRLSDGERPPVIAKLIGDEKRILISSGRETQRYEKVVHALANEGFILKDEKDVKDEDIREASLLVLGFDSPVLKRLYGDFQERTKPGFSLIVRKNPLNLSKVVAAAGGPVTEDAPLLNDFFHYGEYSFVRVEDGIPREKTTTETRSGMSFELYEPVVVLQPRKAERLDDVMPSLLMTPIIYAGERHTDYEDHRVQLKIIRYLYEKGRKFAVGMEMFQRPFQKVMDEYLQGEITEREFLKRTEYFKRWQFDYSQYREIVEYAKAKGIPVIALNIRSEIIKKVSEAGLDSLSEDERKDVPESMDMSDEEYRDRLKGIFEGHRMRGNKSFDNFYQSQILWDETMAHSIDEFLSRNPDHQIVVLAGTGHLMYGSGIPQRAHRRNGRSFITILPEAPSLERDVANYVFFAEPEEPPVTFKLGIVANKTDDGLKIDQIVPRSIANAAGLEEGDIIVAMDDWKVGEVDDIRIFMSDKKRGDSFRISVLRKKFLFGYRPLELKAKI